MTAASTTSMTAASTRNAAPSPRSVRADRAASSMEAFATTSSVEAFASMESHAGARRHYTTTVEAAVVGMARPVVGAVIEVIVVVSFMMLPFTTVLPITVAPVAKVVPITMSPIGQVVPIVKVTKVSIKIMVEVAEEEKRREANVKR